MDMNKLIATTLAVLALTLGGTGYVPTARADYYPSYTWVKKVAYYKKVAYTAYDHYGYPYTAYRWVPVYVWVKVYR